MFFRSTSSIVIILFFYATAFSQEPNAINGQIIDKENGFALDGVSIAHTNNGYGTVSNEEGRFSLNFPKSPHRDSIRFSMLGYKTQVIAVEALLKEKALKVALAFESTILSEIIITEENPLGIIKEAILKIPDNYIADGHIQHGFYRVATQKGPEYIQLSEAVFDIFNYGYGKNKKAQLQLGKVRALRDEQESHGIDLGLKPNLLFDFDIINNVNNNPVLGKEGLQDHRFVLKGIVNYQGQDAYEITFDQKEGKKASLYKGTLYILKEEKTIVAIHYGRSPKGILYSRYGDWATRALLKLMDLNIQIKKDEFRVQYRKSGSKWVLSDAKNETIMQFKSKRKQYDFLADISVDFVNTDIDTTRKAPFPENKVLGNNRFIEYEDVVPDTAFWKGYNTILPDFPVASVIWKIKAANESYNLKKRVQQYLDKLPKNNALRTDSIMEYYFRNGQFNGTALVLHKGNIILDKSYGEADKDRKTMADKHTAYRIGSLSKPFTAMIILQLAQEGKLDIKAPLGNYLPDYVHPELTIAQLLDHTSGLPNCTNNAAYLAELTGKPMSRKDIITKYCSDSLEFKPGSRFAYSNSGYMLLAYIAETVTKKDFSSILQERIFDPLGMKNTYLGWRPGIGNIARGYLYGQKEPDYIVTNLAGAGGITATAYDLSLWNKGMLTGKLLSDTVRKEMYVPRAAYVDWGADYGYGWMLDRQQFAVSMESVVVYHPGTDFGFYSMFVKKDDTESLVILLNNTGDFPRFDMTDLILSNLN